MEPIFVQYLGMAPRKAAKLEKVGWNLKKKDFWHRKAWDQQMVGPNPLHILNPRSCGSSVG